MGERTGIAWTQKTWNPWHGCTKVSAGCDLCYMFREKIRYGQNPELVVRSKTKFRDPLKWSEPSLVFTCSWSDWFHKAADAWRDDAWAIIKATPHLTYQILTKRPGRITRHLPQDWGDGYPNVWLGTSVENTEAVFRIAQLRDVPAQIRFVSAEPLIGGYGLRGLLDGIHWVIDGGESGAGFRPTDLDWFRRHRDDCAEAGVAYFLKQLGGWPNTHADEEAVLDGLTHTAFPAPTPAPSEAR